MTSTNPLIKDFPTLHLAHFVTAAFFTFRVTLFLIFGCINATQKGTTDDELNKPVGDLAASITRQRAQKQIEANNEDADQRIYCCTREFFQRLGDQYKKLWQMYLYCLLYEASATCAMGTVVYFSWELAREQSEWSGEGRGLEYLWPLTILSGLFVVVKALQSADIVSFYIDHPQRTRCLQLFDFNITSQISVAQRTQKDGLYIAWLHKIQVCLVSAPHCVLLFAYILGKHGKYGDHKTDPKIDPKIDPLIYVSFGAQYLNTVITMIYLDGFGDELFYMEDFTFHRILFRLCEFSSRVVVLGLLYSQVSWVAWIIIFMIEFFSYFAYYKRVKYWGNESHYVMGAIFFLPTWSQEDAPETERLKRQTSTVTSEADIQVVYGKIYGFLQWFWIVDILVGRKWFVSSAEKKDVAGLILSRVADDSLLLIMIIVFSLVDGNCASCVPFKTRSGDFAVQQPVMWLVIVAFVCIFIKYVVFKIMDNKAMENERVNQPEKLIHPSNPEFWKRDRQIVAAQFKKWMTDSGVDMHKLQQKQEENLTRIYEFYEKWKDGKTVDPVAATSSGRGNRRQNTKMQRFRTMQTRQMTYMRDPNATSYDDQGQQQKKAKEIERTPFRDYNINEINITGEHKFFEDAYDEGDGIGEPGAFGIASLCYPKNERSVIRVVKKILKVKFYTLDQKARDEFVETLKNEIEILGMIDHPHVVGLIEVFEDKDWLNLILELCEGGELFKQMLDVDCFPEPRAARICQHILLGLHEIQKWDMVHLDLKPENLMYGQKDSKRRPADLKLIDFGMARIIPRLQKHTAKRPIGTAFYMAPEIITGECRFDRAADLWSTGNIAFALLYGFPPFYTDHEEQGIKVDEQGKLEEAIFEMIKEGFDPTVHEDDWGPFFSDDPVVSIYGLHFLEGLLDSVVMTRATTYEALSHPWLRFHLEKDALPLSLFESLTTQSNDKIIQIIASYVYLDHLDRYRVAETMHLFRSWVGTKKDGRPKHRIGKKRFVERIREACRLPKEEAVKCWEAMHMRPKEDSDHYLRLEDFLLSTSFVTMRYNDERIRFVYEKLLEEAKGEKDDRPNRLTPQHVDKVIDKYPRLQDFKKWEAAAIVRECEGEGRLGRLRQGPASIKYENFIEAVHPQFAKPFIFRDWTEIEGTLPFNKEEFDAILEEVENMDCPLSQYFISSK